MSITPQELARRVSEGVRRQDRAYAWLLGAGCSVSSGVPAARECVGDWLKQLKYLETGRATGALEWAAGRFPGFSAEDPATLYRQVFEALFSTAAERRHEVDRMRRAARPGFGYATLGQLIAHPRWGARFNRVFSPNIDGLAFDALLLYCQLRAQLVSSDCLNAANALSPQAPLVVTLPSEAHSGHDEGGAPDRLSDLIAERDLIIVGYGGRDARVHAALPARMEGAVYWVADTAPPEPFADWLAEQESFWVRNDDFDSLMYGFRLEFGLGHPQITRFEEMLRLYHRQYVDLSRRWGEAS